jgi:glycosyltransferase involved in cell wall biosynthesis
VKRPIISVVIPTYNNAALLTETLDGVKQQTVQDVEIIVVDDGSTDQTAQVVKKYDPSILYHYQSNQRQAAARNKGVDLATGEYIAFCDHDDIWNAGHLEALLRCFEFFPEASMAFDNAEYFGGATARRFHLKPDSSESLNHQTIGVKFLLWKYPVASMSVVMLRRECFQTLNGLNETVGVMDDYHFYLRLAARSELRYVDFVGCRKRVSNSNLSRLSNLKEMNLLYLEDIRHNHPEVVHKIGAVSYKLRLGRKYFKLGRYYAENGDIELAREMYRKAFTTNFLNPRYLYHAQTVRRK